MFATISENPSSLIRKGKKTAVQIPSASLFGKTDDFMVRQSEKSVVKQPIKMTA